MYSLDNHVSTGDYHGDEYLEVLVSYLTVRSRTVQKLRRLTLCMILNVNCIELKIEEIWKCGVSGLLFKRYCVSYGQ